MGGVLTEKQREELLTWRNNNLYNGRFLKYCSDKARENGKNELTDCSFDYFVGLVGKVVPTFAKYYASSFGYDLVASVHVGEYDPFAVVRNGGDYLRHKFECPRFEENWIGGGIGMFELILGLGLLYYRKYDEMKTGDGTFIKNHASVISKAYKNLDEVAMFYTDKEYSEIDQFNFTYKNVEVRDGKITNPALIPYVVDVCIPELLLVDTKKFVRGDYSEIRRKQIGCALAVICGKDELWFINLVNNALIYLVGIPVTEGDDMEYVYG